MRIDNPSQEQLRHYFKRLDEHAGQTPQWIKYLDLGTHIVKLINYSPEFTPHVQKQLTYVLKNSAPHHDATLVIWKETDIKALTLNLDEKFNPKTNLRLRVEMLAFKTKSISLQVFDETYSKHQPLLNIDPYNGIVQAHNPKTNTYYYAAENLEPEEFIKQGHIFVHTLNKIIKTPNSGLVHGAVVGLDNKGILFCARGQRGKSTLAVLAMMEGFEYVSDDYLTLSKDETGLYADPIYSIITLSPRMYNELYNDLQGKFVSNNARKDKYVINIAPYHERFRRHYPISVCMFPEIVSGPEPEIVPCDKYSKGRAITQLIHSTINQTGDRHDMETIRKLMSFVNDFEFYKINLCADIQANVECLRNFITDYNKRKEKSNDELCVK
ncbi:MAG: hypothetical protein LBK53_03635 [Heliobacteriaceae bacterium]|jgi:hypothetical protein|nr:hypothetical protein [Heliobacteriaceae bacterium]